MRRILFPSLVLFLAILPVLAFADDQNAVKPQNCRITPKLIAHPESIFPLCTEKCCRRRVSTTPAAWAHYQRWQVVAVIETTRSL